MNTVHKVNPSAPPVTGSVEMQDPDFYKNTETVSERAQRWFYRPLEELNNPDDGFAILTLLFPLVEKYLRFSNSMSDTDGFSDNCPAIQEFARITRINVINANHVWSSMRNGLLHQAAIKSMKVILAHTGDPIRLEGENFIINPWALRDIFLPLFKSHGKMWKDSDYPMLYEYLPS